jgi:sugar lactone lactonase YvrE
MALARTENLRSNTSLLKSAVLILLLLLVPAICWASFSLTFQGLVETVNTGGSITLSSPAGVVLDTAGNLFIADTGHNQIVTVNAQGAASVLTITGLSPALSSPAGIAIDGSGNLYIADTGNSRIVKITPAGSGSVIATGSVTLSSPKGIALDQSGDIFVADTGNSRIVEVTSGGSASALSITGLSSPSTLNTPIGLAVDTAGNLYFADSVNNRVVKVAAGGTVGTVVSIAGGVTLATPSSVAVDRIGNLFIADTGNSRIAEVDSSGNGSVLFTDSVTLSGALGVALDIFGTVYIADTGHNRGLIVSPPVNADVTPGDPTYSLNKSAVGFGHLQLGTSTGTTLTLPFTIGSTALGSVKVFTSGTQNLDFTAGTDTTCSGSTGTSASCSVEITFLPTAPGLRTGAVVLYDGSQNPILTIPLYGFADAPLAALAPSTATLISTGAVVTQYPFQLALDGAGNMYVGNYTQTSSNPQVVKIPAGGGSASVVSTSPVVIGSGSDISITGVAIDAAGNLFIADYYGEKIVVVTPGGVASALSISGLSPALGEPTELAFDGAGNLYIADYSPTARIVRVSSLIVSGSTSTGVGTVVNTGSYTFSGNSITGVAVAPNGTVYIAARTSNTSHVVQVTAGGVASLLTPTGLTLSDPQGAFVDSMGNLYVEDSGNSRIVRITTAGVASAVSVTGLTTPATLSSGFGVTTDAFGNLYIPDWTNNRIVFVNVSGAALTFASTNEGLTSTDSPKTATVTNLGNQALVFSANPAYTANFSNNSGDTDPCTSSTSLASGMVCDVSVNFTPQSVGSLSAGIAVTNNTRNVAGSTQQVSVSGTGVTAGDTTSLAVSVNPTSASIAQPITVTATVFDTATGHTTTVPTDSVNFSDTVGSTTVMLNAGSPVTIVAGHATLTGATLSGLGSHTITANYGGVSGSFLSSSNTTTVTVTKDTGAVSGPATQPVSIPPGQAGSAVITVAKPYSGAAMPSGSIAYTILNASNTSVASGTLTLTAGTTSATATVPIPNALTPGTYTIHVSYSGDSNYSASSAPTTIAVSITGFTLTLAASGATSATVSPGGTATYALTIAPSSGTTFPGAVALTVTGLPTGATAALTPSTLPAGSGSTRVALTVLVPAQTASIPTGTLSASRLSARFALPSLLLGMVFLPFGGSFRRAVRKHGHTPYLLLLMLAGLSLVGLMGCASQNSGYFGQPVTNYTLTVTATSGTLSHSTTLGLTVQ